MKHHYKITGSFLFVCAFLVSILSCSTEAEENHYTEPVKNISGSWQVVQAFRNEADITDLMEFGEFKINFKEDQSYTLENYIPFLVSKPGTWSLDDPQYPLNISFSEDAGTDKVQTQLNFPIQGGKRQIRLTFSPGCSSNSYTYVFEKAPQ